MWVGQIEGTASDEANNKGGYRYKVRIIGDHPQDKSLLQTSELPWANVMMPVNVPFMPGNIGGGDPQLVEGCWVIGFYMDNMKQKPLILGSIGQTPGSTTVVKNVRPDDPGFTHGTRSGAYAPNPAKDGQESPENREVERVIRPLKLVVVSQTEAQMVMVTKEFLVQTRTIQN